MQEREEVPRVQCVENVKDRECGLPARCDLTNACIGCIERGEDGSVLKKLHERVRDYKT